MSHAINSTNPCINARLCGVTNKHSGAVTKTDVIINKMHRSDDVSLCPGSGVFKMFAGNVLFRAIIGTCKKNYLKQFLQSLQAKKKTKKNILCNNNDQTCFSDTLTSAGPLPSPFRFCFQDLPRGPADINA